MTVPKSRTVGESTDPDVDPHLHVTARRPRPRGVREPIVCGAMTACSTFSRETSRKAGGGPRGFAAVESVARVVAGPGAVFVGVACGEALWT